MEDVEKPKSKLDELEEIIRRRQSVTYQIECMRDRLSELSTFYKKFEEVTKKMGHVSPRALREKRRREKKKLIKQSADLLVGAT